MMSPTEQKLLAENAQLRDQVAELVQRLRWFEKQIFGQKSEKQPFNIPGQESLFPNTPIAPAIEPSKIVPAYQRGTAKKVRPDNCVSDSGLRFGPNVPVITIPVIAPELNGAHADNYCIIDTKITHKLAQRPESYVVLRYETPVVKCKKTAKINSPAMPAGIFEGSIADVSLVSGMLVEKFQYHMPLYRQHQRMQQDGITISRASLIKYVQSGIELLRPIVNAQLANVIASQTLILDETPIKVGRDKTDVAKKGKMHQGQIWPIYGDQDEIVFTYASRRATEHIKTQLKDFKGTILSDGYSAYACYAQQTEGIVHAQCWIHVRRKFIEAENTAPDLAPQVVALIGELYRLEAEIRKKGLIDEEKRLYRQKHCAPVVDAIFAWGKNAMTHPNLTPKHAMSKALNYMLTREASLRVFLDDAAVAPDTNQIERQIRPIALGRKNWLFCWTEIGAEHVAIIQSLICTCKLHDIDPKVYLLDVLQRVAIHPASRVEELTPRKWKSLFADQPLGVIF
jgi:transposase